MAMDARSFSYQNHGSDTSSFKFSRIRTNLLLSTFFWFFLSPLLYPAFEINKLGAKSSAFNEAYSTLASDPWGILYNPAQSVRMDGAQAAIGYSRPDLDFGDFQANLVSGFFMREALGTAYGLGVIFTDTNVYYREFTGILNLGRRIGEPEDSWDLALGTNLKILSLRRGDPTKLYDPALVPQTINKFTADIGAHARFQRFFLGISANDLIPANMGVVVRESVPVETRFGIGAKRLWEIPNTGFKISPALELANRNHDTSASGGAEIELLDFLNLILGAGSRNVTFGFSVLLNPFISKPGSSGGPSPKNPNIFQKENVTYQLNVSYVYPLTGVDTVGSPLVGMNFLF